MANGEIVEGTLVRQAEEVSGMLMTPGQAKAELARLQEFVHSVMKEGVDFGIIPGTGNKPTLLKPGAEKLNEIYGYAPVVEITDKVEDWRGQPPFFNYEVKVKLVSKRSDVTVAEGVGSCNSMEKRYRYRDAKPKCPTCGKETIFKSKQKPEFYCWQKQGGCGAIYKLDDPAITGQPIGKVINEDTADMANTILKMAKKRALVDATLSATRSSELFTQDIEDFAEAQPAEPVAEVKRPAAPAAKAAPKPPVDGPSEQEDQAKAHTAGHYKGLTKEGFREMLVGWSNGNARSTKDLKKSECALLIEEINSLDDNAVIAFNEIGKAVKAEGDLALNGE